LSHRPSSRAEGGRRPGEGDGLEVHHTWAIIPRVLVESLSRSRPQLALARKMSETEPEGGRGSRQSLDGLLRRWHGP
jgi:hypothetical protein